MKKALITALTCGMVIASAGAATAAPRPDRSVADCTVGAAPNLTYTNYEARAGFNVFCSSAHWIVAEIEVYDAPGNPLGRQNAGSTKLNGDGQWHYLTSLFNWGHWKPVAHACLWIYQDNSVAGPLLYSGCTL
ncbi:hypothetical protein SMC26_34555 [Actinomadura fulvescens]|uniref:Secreted protein n=1 Tax=Actinomadura fulvescens TaxID=46160 RepID=A0ABP6D4S5_9ACTN